MNLDEFGDALKTMLQNIIKSLSKYFVLLTMSEDRTAMLEIQQNLDYKYMLLLRLHLICSKDEDIRQNISFKYGYLNARYDFLTTRLKDVASIIKLKNPNLLLQIQKSLALN